MYGLAQASRKQHTMQHAAGGTHGGDMSVRGGGGGESVTGAMIRLLHD